MSDRAYVTASRSLSVATLSAAVSTLPARFAAAKTVFFPVFIRRVAFLALISAEVQAWDTSSIPLASKT